MTVRTTHVALLMLLAGCGGTFDSNKNMPDPVCRQVVYQDPAVRTELDRVAGGTGSIIEDNRVILYEAEMDAYSRCMRQRSGSSQRGGVERVRR